MPYHLAGYPGKQWDVILLTIKRHAERVGVSNEQEHWMDSLACPTESEIAAFALGELPSATIDQLAAHIGDCASCNARLASLDNRSNDFVEKIREGTRLGRAANDNAPPGDSTAYQAAGPAILPASEGPGSRIGHYRVRESLGEGGFGTVFLAD